MTMRGWRAGARARHGCVAALAALVVLGAPSVAAQTASRGEPLPARAEAELLREASAHEWRGAFDEAETLLREVLDRNPTSIGGLFALERVLRIGGRATEVLPHIDRFLAEEPAASGPRYMHLRILAEADSLAGLERAAEAWFRVAPGDPEPYREVARIQLRRGDAERALDVLAEGQRAVGDDAPLALEVGDARMMLGDPEGAAEAWARSLASPDADVEGVLRRVTGMEGERATLAEPILAALTAPGAATAYRSAAVRLAVALERPDLALRVASAGLVGLSARAAPGYLRDVAARADGAGMPDLARWARGALQRTPRAGRGSGASPEQAGVDALVRGDTAEALAAQRRRLDSLPGRGDARRQGWAELLHLEAAWGAVEVDALVAEFERFTRDFPDAAERDGLAARVAAVVAREGRADDALRVVAEPAGPASLLERGWLRLEAGEREEGRADLADAARGLGPAEATPVIQLLATLARVGPAAGDALVESGLRHRRGDLVGARRSIEDAVETAPDPDRPPLLLQAGLLALQDADTAAARAHYARVEGAHFESPEAPEAMLLHARLLATDPARTDEARERLERLILERPGAAVVPAARTELARLGRRR